jgi:hypothetical protein
VLGQRAVLGAQAFQEDAVERVEVDQRGAVLDTVAQDAEEFSGEGGVALAVGGQGDPVAG